MAEMETRTWITFGEVAALGVLLLFELPTAIRVIVGVPLLLHLGWSVLTSVPAGKIPGPPPGVGERRRNHQLRYRVVQFLNELQRLEAYTLQGDDGTVPKRELEKAEERLQSVVTEAVRSVGRTGV